MGRGAQSLSRVAVVVRAGVVPLWWPGVVAAAAGVFVPGLVGRLIGFLVGAALFLVTVGVVASVRMGRYAELARGASRAGLADTLQGRADTVLGLWRTYQWWLGGAFLVALGAGLVLPGAGGLVLAGVGAGLWVKALRIGQWERRDDALYWVRTDSVRRGRPAGEQVEAYWVTGPVAGDAAPGGGRRRRG